MGRRTFAGTAALTSLREGWKIMADLRLAPAGLAFGLESLEGRRLLSSAPPYANALDNDVAYAADGALHVAWYDSSTGSLEYATRSASGTWSNQVTIDEIP